jgi:long-chain acyl-CoA synthetase
VVGEQKDHIAALIVIDANTVGAWAELRKMQYTGFRNLAAKDEVVELISERIQEVNSKIKEIGGSGCPEIKRFTILHKEFNVNKGEMTRSHKIRRDVVSNNYRPLLDALYSGADQFDVTDSKTGEVVTQLRLQTAQ